MARLLSLLQLALLCLSAVSLAAPAPEDGATNVKRDSNACGRIVNSGSTLGSALSKCQILTLNRARFRG